MADELQDPYDRQSGSGEGTGKAVLSWVKADVGDEVTGVVVPADLAKPAVGYRLSRAWDNDAREPQVWAPRGYINPASGKPWKGPVVRSIFDANAGEGEEARPVVRTEIVLMTNLRNFEFVSRPYLARAREEGLTDDGIRRFIVDGASAREAHDAAIEALKALDPTQDRPKPAQTWKIKLASQSPNDKGGHTNGIAIDATLPTPETKAIVAKYLAEAGEAAEAATPYGGKQEDPPF